MTTEAGDLVESRPAKSEAGAVVNAKEALNRERRRVYRAAKAKQPVPQKAAPPEADPKPKTNAGRAKAEKKLTA